MEHKNKIRNSVRERAQAQYGTVTTVDVSINLSVTPVVTAQGSVFLQVNVTRESPAGTTGIESGNALKVQSIG